MIRVRLATSFLLLAGLASVDVVAQDEVPFVTTPDAVTLAMLQIAGVGAGDRVVDLGSGDGRIVITAARRFGASGLGVELVPELVQRSRAAARSAGVHERVEFREQDLFRTDLAGATVVTMYLLPDVNLMLRPRLLALPAGTRIVSHDYDLGDWQPDRTVTIDVPDKPLGRDKFSRVHFWRVPAQVAGRWCAPGFELEIAQRFQRFSATLAVPGRAAPAAVFDGRIDGTRLQADGLGVASLELAGPTLTLRGVGAAALPARAAFTRSATTCPA